MENLKYDVVIIGGGTSGCACAYIAANSGLKTLLVEKNNYLGGLMTGGLVVPVMKSSIDEFNCEYYKKLVETAKKYRAQIKYKNDNDGWFNPELMKIVLEDLLVSDTNNNLSILYETDVKDVEINSSRLTKIILNSRMLSIPVQSTYFVDATGQGSLLKLSGCKFLPDNNIKQQNSLRFILGNVDIEKFAGFITSLDKDENITNTYRNDIDTNNELHLTTASTWDTSTYWALDKYLQKGVNEGILEPDDRSYFQVFTVASGTGQIAFNCPRINNYNDNPFMYSLELQNARRAIYRLYTFVKKYFAGFENAIITNIAPQTGIREEGRLNSRYIYSKDDLISGKKFNNPVLSANYSIDIHSDKKDGSVLQKITTYQLPIEALMSADIDNLFAIGKLVGADFEAHSALRVQKSCMSMGEAVAKYIKTH
ncbi:FAD-dependent oxidoreductase [bacterium]|nr:FAD-dependent oxidoreductase [bacterium]